jgi:manganese/zinc/iron transport system permease protein
MELFILLFTDYTLRTVALGAMVLGLVSGTLSAFAVLRKQSLLGDAMSHAALPGVVLAFILTGSRTPLALMTGAMLAGWLGALLVQVVITQTRIKQDSALGIVLAVFFGLGLAMLTWVQRQGSANQAGLDTFLFGRASALIMQDVWTMIGLGAVALFLVMLFWKEFKLLSFDPDFAASLGFPVQTLGVMLTTLIVVAVVVGLQTVGVVLMSALLVAPAAAARQWTDRLGSMVALSAFFGALSGVSGALISSMARGVPTGPTVVISISLIVLISLFLAPRRGLVWRSVRRRRSRGELRRLAVLEALYVMATHHQDPTHPHSLDALRAAIPGLGVQHTLLTLRQEGLAQEQAGQWSLTAQGVEVARSFLGQESASGQPGEASPQPTGGSHALLSTD